MRSDGLCRLLSTLSMHAAGKVPDTTRQRSVLFDTSFAHGRNKDSLSTLDGAWRGSHSPTCQHTASAGKHPCSRRPHTASPRRRGLGHTQDAQSQGESSGRMASRCNSGCDSSRADRRQMTGRIGNLAALRVTGKRAPVLTRLK
jgi:hypothetical protein